MDWFYVAFGLLGLLTLLSAVYEWNWLWKLARGGYWPDQIGWHNTRVLYLVGGAGVLGSAISRMFQSILATDSALTFIPGFLIAAGLTEVLFRSRNKQSIIAFLRNKENATHVE